MPVRSPSSTVLCSPPNPLLHRSPLRFPSRQPTTVRRLFLATQRMRLKRAACWRVRKRFPKPHLPWRDKGLPGYWAILFARAMVIHTPPVRRRLAQYWWRHCCLQVIRHLGLCRNVLFSGPHTHGSHVRYLRFNDDVAAVAARLTAGLPGSALARWVSHPLDD